jgi:DNA primase
MRKFPPELLQKIRDAVNILEVVGEHVVLRKTGANYVGLCPFHSERSPSFSVSENKQLYHCYGCKKGGDLFSFVMEIHGIGFPEAIEELAERARIALPRDVSAGGSGSGDEGRDPEEVKRREAIREKTATAYKLNRFVAAFYHQNLPKFLQAHRYLYSRGVGDEWQRSFYLGAASPGWDQLTQHLVAKKAPLPLAVELGLIKPSTKGASPGGPGYFDLFRNRVMFPILNLRGKVAGFGGRQLPSDDSEGSDDRGDGPKYLNSSESFLFAKSKLAYGLYQAQKHIREKDEVILVEGYFDVLALHAAGFQNVVASCGTALTPDHLAVFRRFASRITLLFDGDKAGVAATERAMELGLQHGLVLNGAVMPEGLDPDEILFDQETGAPRPEGQAQMREILEKARPLLDVRMEEAISQARQSPEAKTQSIKRMGQWLAQFKDPVGQEVRLEWLQGQLGVSRDLLQQAMGTMGGGRSRNSSQNSFGVVSTVQQPRTQSALNSVGPSGRASAAPRSAGNTGRIGSSRNAGRLSAGEKVLLAGLAKGGECSVAFSQAMEKLPSSTTLADLFDYAPAQELVRRAMQSSDFQDGAGPIGLSQSLLTESDLDSQVRSTLTEAWVGGETPFAVRDFQVALDRSIARLWARFSQRIKTALAEAEAKKDAGLHSKLMKEYLDVQRKMKEFNSFYDEA